ncbi:translational GTPase TypA [Candidatus Saccharibacteria bacterium]|nr:translational GTPase TypA [Candidatus Saccharibacteria bacterium]
MLEPDKIRNIAIIAHVDHGKTTLVDGLLKQSNTFRDNSAEMAQQLIMDSGDQERERGITITAKTTAIRFGDYKINIIDTPGHADFSGEVERTLQMADGVLLVVDAAEGPMPQTKFVLSKALQLGLKPIVVINKIDKPARRIQEVENEVSDLFLELATEDSQLDYPIYFAVARAGKSWNSMPDNVDEHADLTPIFEAIVSEIPAPDVEVDGPFQMLITSLQYDNFLGKYAIGKIAQGVAKSGSAVSLINGEIVTAAKIDKLFTYQGLAKSEVKEAGAGDIVAIVGATTAGIGETLADANQPEALPTIQIEPPTISVYLGPNTSPFKGREGEFTTSRQIGERLNRELETNVALKVEPSGIGFTISGRGELHLSVLMESLRREGYEFEVGRPQVVLKEENGQKLEPVEEVFVEVAPEFAGAVAQEFGTRHAELLGQETTTQGTLRSNYRIATRGLIGMRNILLTATKGTLIMNSLPAGYQQLGAKLTNLRNGTLIASETGTSTPYALANAESRGEFFIPPSVEVYAGQIVGLNARKEDLEINVTKAKNLTNMRSKSSDGTVQLTPYTDLSLEQCLDFINDDELLEITPKNLRLRKSELDPNQRKRQSRA